MQDPLRRSPWVELRFEAKALVDSLSQYIGMGVVVLTCKSLKRQCNHVISHVQSAKALYSASVKDLETTNCFLDDQYMRHESRKIANPKTDILVMGHAA
ncbi:hypothetical protein Tco_0400357 [Tanacetum coccineum]